MRAPGGNRLETLHTTSEQGFTAAAKTAREFHCYQESTLAAKRALSYNPNSRENLDMVPDLAPLYSEISKMVGRYTAAVSQQSNHRETCIGLGYCYLAFGDFANSYAFFLHALKSGDDTEDDPYVAYAAGIVYAHYRHYPEAHSYLEKALRAPVSMNLTEDILLRIAFIDRAGKKFESALQALQRVKKNPPNGLIADDIDFQIAYTLELWGESGRAQEIYADLRARYPSCEKVIEQYCWSMYRSAKNPADLQRVKGMVDEANAQSPKNSTLVLVAARIAMKQSDLTAAYEHYKFCISYYTESPFFWWGLGALYYENRQEQDAFIAFQKAAYLKSDLPEVWLNMGLIYEEKQQVQNAVSMYETGIERCAGSRHEFQERISALTQSGRRVYRQDSPQLVDVDDGKFITVPAEEFATEYIEAVPRLPAVCFKEDGAGDRFAPLSTLPPSLFAK